MSEEKKPIEASRQSSPRFPFISLSKALDRVEQLRKAASFGFAPVLDIRDVWGYGPKSSGGDQTVAALGYYGLIDEHGSGSDRRIKISELGARYLRDERPEVRRSLQEQMVQSPKAMKALWDLWKRDIPSDAIARSILKNDLAYSDSAAGQILSVYRDNLHYFPTGGSEELLDEKSQDGDREAVGDSNSASNMTVEVGDWVQWSPGGVDKFHKSRKVTWVDKESGFLRVEGSMTGVPLAEVATAKPPSDDPSGRDTGKLDDDFSVLMTGKRLQISAEVDREGLQRLLAVLGKYAEILELLQES